MGQQSEPPTAPPPPPVSPFAASAGLPTPHHFGGNGCDAEDTITLPVTTPNSSIWAPAATAHASLPLHPFSPPPVLFGARATAAAGAGDGAAFGAQHPYNNQHQQQQLFSPGFGGSCGGGGAAAVGGGCWGLPEDLGSLSLSASSGSTFGAHHDSGSGHSGGSGSGGSAHSPMLQSYYGRGGVDASVAGGLLSPHQHQHHHQSLPHLPANTPLGLPFSSEPPPTLGFIGGAPPPPPHSPLCLSTSFSGSGSGGTFLHSPMPARGPGGVPSTPAGSNGGLFRGPTVLFSSPSGGSGGATASAAGGPLPRCISADSGLLQRLRSATLGTQHAQHAPLLAACYPQQQGSPSPHGHCHYQQMASNAATRAASVQPQLWGARGGSGGSSGSPPQLPLTAAGRRGDGGCSFAAFAPVFDMKSLTAVLGQVQAGTGDVRRVLTACTFKPRLPGLTKLVSNLSKEGQWAKALEVYEALDAVGVRPDTTITNAAITACDKGSQWEAALALFQRMAAVGMARDAITYSALISALSKGRQWGMAIHVFNHMVQEGVECDAVTCCSLITALDKGGKWQLAEQVFKQMYCADPSLLPLLAGMDEDTPCGAGAPAAASLASAFSVAALDALSGGGGPSGLPLDCGSLGGGAAALPPAEELTAALVNGGKSLPLFATAAAGNSPPSSPPGGGGAAGNGSSTSAGSSAIGSPLQQQERVGSGGIGAPATTTTTTTAGVGASPFSAAALLSAGSSNGPVVAPPLGRADSLSAALARAGSGGLARAGSISAKKASPNRVCCNALLASYARAVPAQWRRALVLLEGMWACGGELMPDIVSYNTAIKAAGAAREVTAAFELFNEMRSRKIEPTSATFGALLAVASDAGDWPRVVEAWRWLQGSGLPVHVGCANAYMGALLQMGDWAGALQVLAGMRACGGGLKPTTATFNTLMAVCGEAGHTELALELFDDMISSNLAPNHATLAALAAALARGGCWGRVGDVLRHMGSPGGGAPPTAATYAPLFRAIADAATAATGGADRAAACARAVDLYSMLMEQGVAPDAQLYSQMVAAFSACGAHAMVLRLTLTMAERRWLGSDGPTLTRGLEAAAAQGAWDLLPRLLRGARDARVTSDRAAGAQHAQQGSAVLATGAAAAGEGPTAGDLHALLLRCAAAQAWSAAEGLIAFCAETGLLGDQEAVASPGAAAGDDNGGAGAVGDGAESSGSSGDSIAAASPAAAAAGDTASPAAI